MVVIGERGRRVAPDAALEHVAGYTIANDVSMRDYQYKTHQWLQGKAWDASTPVGPDLVTLDEITEPLMLRTFVNGENVQEASTELLIFDVATLVSTLSEFATLEPGDLILTGTPGGVGYRREPQLLLADGDVVVVELDQVGRIENRCVADQASAARTAAENRPRPPRWCPTSTSTAPRRRARPTRRTGTRAGAMPVTAGGSVGEHRVGLAPGA